MIGVNVQLLGKFEDAGWYTGANVFISWPMFQHF